MAAKALIQHAMKLLPRAKDAHDPEYGVSLSKLGWTKESPPSEIELLELLKRAPKDVVEGILTALASHKGDAITKSPVVVAFQQYWMGKLAAAAPDLQDTPQMKAILTVLADSQVWKVFEADPASEVCKLKLYMAGAEGTKFDPVAAQIVELSQEEFERYIVPVFEFSKRRFTLHELVDKAPSDIGAEIMEIRRALCRFLDCWDYTAGLQALLSWAYRRQYLERAFNPNWIYRFIAELELFLALTASSDGEAFLHFQRRDEAKLNQEIIKRVYMDLFGREVS